MRANGVRCGWFLKHRDDEQNEERENWKAMKKTSSKHDINKQTKRAICDDNDTIKCIHWIRIDSINARASERECVCRHTHSQWGRTKGRSKRSISYMGIYREPFRLALAFVLFVVFFTIFGNPAHKQLNHSKCWRNENGEKINAVCINALSKTTRMKKLKELKPCEWSARKRKKRVKRHDFITIFVAVFHYSAHIATVFLSASHSLKSLTLGLTNSSASFVFFSFALSTWVTLWSKKLYLTVCIFYKRDSQYPTKKTRQRIKFMHL